MFSSLNENSTLFSYITFIQSWPGVFQVIVDSNWEKNVKYVYFQALQAWGFKIF